MLPNNLQDFDEQIHASLEGLDSTQLWNIGRAVEVLDPAAKVHNQRHPIIDVDLIWCDNRVARLKIVCEADYIRQVNKTRNRETGLTKESA